MKAPRKKTREEWAAEQAYRDDLTKRLAALIEKVKKLNAEKRAS